MKRIVYLVLCLALVIPLLFVNAADAEKTDKSVRKLPETAEELGKLLFSELMLSLDYTLACDGCHKPELAFADTVPFNTGVGGKFAARNTPSIMNLAGHSPFFYDGRAATLEEQALGPIANPVEMALPIDSALARLNRDPFYSKAFRNLYHSKVTAKNLGAALAAFERTLNTNAPWDKFVRGDSSAVSASALRGRTIFNVKGKCFECHKGVDFTTDEFKNIGLYNGKDLNDRGRFDFNKDSSDLGKFKTPGLRNVSVTAPYMHNGMFKTLREVINYYNEPQRFVTGSINSDTLVKPLNLSETEKNDLEAFLRTLTNEQFTHTR